MKDMIMVPTESSRMFTPSEYSMLYDLSYNGPMIMVGQYEELPIPWDAEISIVDLNGEKMLQLVGHAGPSGLGFCCTKVPLKIASGMVKIVLEPKDLDSEYVLKSLLSNAGWETKEL